MQKFPADFIWGTSTAAFQIEGGALEDGRTDSIWDVFSRTAGKIKDGHAGENGADHYHRLDEDLDWIASAAPHYRFSFSWSRLIPDGIGEINPKGVAFYNRLIDGLLARGVTPWATMYHWDLPQALQDRGGWTNRAVLDWFSEYADVLTRTFGDRVKHWIILNEPSAHSWMGHALGVHAPGLASVDAYLSSAHHMNVVIGRVYRQVKSWQPDIMVGSSYTLSPVQGPYPEPVATLDALWNRNFFEPLFNGAYPREFSAAFSPWVSEGDLATIKAPLDFVGVQHYNPIDAKYDEVKIFSVDFGAADPALPATDIGWTIKPSAFRDILHDFSKRYGTGMPIIITENGAAFIETVNSGACDDPKRIAYLESYIAAMQQAMRAGVNVKGYFVWSLLDNFEWANGYDYRFGLIYVDYQDDYRRLPKSSYNWYRELNRRSSE